MPEDEARRLAVLAEFAALDTAPEPELDAQVRRLAQVCDAPIALLGLLDVDRQWFKASVGSDVRQFPRSAAFCAHTILGDDILEVPDAASDPRFAANPLVTGDPGIRFYAGVPLRSAEGHNVGTVCVLDRRPRRLSGAQRDVLRQVGRDVMAQLERRRQGRAPLVDRMLETVDRDAKPATPGEPPLAGSRFGRYTILDEIGRGAMATVYTAYDDQLDRKVAIKLIRDPDAHVHQEAQAVARISHPNVVQIYEIGRFEGQEFIAMELIDGVNLTTWQAIRSRNVYDIIAMYAQAGRGLAAAHRVGLVHRDFKPKQSRLPPKASPSAKRRGSPQIGAFEREEVCPRVVRSGQDGPKLAQSWARSCRTPSPAAGHATRSDPPRTPAGRSRARSSARLRPSRR